MIQTLDELWTFTPQRVYMLVAIARSKENDDVRATDQPTMRKVIEDADEISDKLDQLQHAAARFDNRYRLYATVNGRNAWSAYTALQQEMVYQREEHRKSDKEPHILKRIDHRWKSILHQPRCRDEKRFLWDVDDASVEARHEILVNLKEHTEVLAVQETPNGWHIVTEPFNFNEVEGYDVVADTINGFPVERKNDDMIYLGFLDGEEVSFPV